MVFAVGFFYLGKDQCECPVVKDDTGAGGGGGGCAQDCTSASTAAIASWFNNNC